MDALAPKNDWISQLKLLSIASKTKTSILTKNGDLLLNSNLFQFNDGGGRRFARRVISGLEPSDRNILGNINSCLFRRFLVFFAADFFLKVRATFINLIMKHFKTKIF